jgi:hypothetical protein
MTKAEEVRIIAEALAQARAEGRAAGRAELEPLAKFATAALDIMQMEDSNVDALFFDAAIECELMNDAYEHTPAARALEGDTA